MKVSFDEIPEDGLELTITDQGWLPRDVCSIDGQAQAFITLKRVDTRVALNGSVECPVKLVCDRCLVDYSTVLKSDLSVYFECITERQYTEIQEEHACSESEMNSIELDTPTIDLFSFLKQQLYLMISPKSLCNEKCKGLCYQCGKNLNLGQCACSGVDVDNPFSVLTTLKDN